MNETKKCDNCGGLISGEGHAVYDENWNKLKGLKQCTDCAYAYGDLGLHLEPLHSGVPFERMTEFYECFGVLLLNSNEDK